jgi:Domain of unknown function (DUF4136)
MRAAAAMAIVVALGALGTPAAAQQFKVPKVEVDHDNQTDFASFKTYSWKEATGNAEDIAMHVRIIWYVERELEKKGLKKAKPGETGDVLVRYYAKKKESVKGTPSQGETYLPGGAGQLTTSVEIGKVVEGTLLVELQRADDERAVWRAATEYQALDKQRIDAQTKSAVRLLFSKYPPPGAQPPEKPPGRP